MLLPAKTPPFCQLPCLISFNIPDISSSGIFTPKNFSKSLSLTKIIFLSLGSGKEIFASNFKIAEISLCHLEVIDVIVSAAGQNFSVKFVIISPFFPLIPLPANA